MTEATSRWRTTFLGAAAIAASAALVAACVPPPGGSTTTTTYSGEPSPPTVQSFGVHGGVGPAPSLVTFSWQVTDPNLGPLTCRIDGDGDGVTEVTVSNCHLPGYRNVSVAEPGPHTATISVEDGTFPPVTAHDDFTVPAGVSETFSIDLRGVEELDPEVAAAFEHAVDTWEAIIVRGLPDVTPFPTPLCLPSGVEPLPEEIDDVLVDVGTPVIDGSGGILGRAGPTCVRPGVELGYHGIMEFDAADVADMVEDGSLGDVIEHELGHVLGIGTLWDMSWSATGVRRLLSGEGGPNPTFLGVAARAEYSQLGRSGSVPVEGAGGPGTRDSHWRESTFDDELMTGWINPTPNPLSRLTAASLADLGYRVELGGADPYSLPGSSASLRRAPAIHDHDAMIRPAPGFG